MAIKKIFQFLIMTGALLSPLWAGEVNVKNDTTVTVSVTIRGKENKSANSPFNLTRDIQPGKSITVTLDEKEFEGVTFSVQGTTVAVPPLLTLTSNECVLTGCEGKVVFSTKSDGSALVCIVTHAGHS